MAYTVAQRDALQEKLAAGILTVTFDGSTTTYQSADDMRATLREMNRQIEAASIGATTLGTVRVSVVKD